jgi:hypothetical protein
MTQRVSIPYPDFLPFANYRQGDLDKLVATVRTFTGCWVQQPKTQRCFREIRRAARLTHRATALQLIQRPQEDPARRRFRERADAQLATFVLAQYGKARGCLVWGLSAWLWVEIGTFATRKPVTVDIRIEPPPAMPPPTLAFVVRYGETREEAKKRLIGGFERYWKEGADPWQKALRGSRKGLRTWGREKEPSAPYKPVEQHAYWYFLEKILERTRPDIDREYRCGRALSNSHQTIADGIEEARHIIDDDPLPVSPDPSTPE